MNIETLAQTLHEAGREAVEKNLVVRTDVPVRGFVEWADLTEEAREGRRVQARFLLERFDLIAKGTGSTPTPLDALNALVPQLQGWRVGREVAIALTHLETAQMWLQKWENSHGAGGDS